MFYAKLSNPNMLIVDSTMNDILFDLDIYKEDTDNMFAKYRYIMNIHVDNTINQITPNIFKTMFDNTYGHRVFNVITYQERMKYTRQLYHAYVNNQTNVPIIDEINDIMYEWLETIFINSCVNDSHVYNINNINECKNKKTSLKNKLKSLVNCVNVENYYEPYKELNTDFVKNILFSS